LFGINTKPLHKVLEYSTNPYIPGVSGSESGAIQFLHQLGIEPKDGEKWKKLVHLTDEEKQRLVAGVIMKRFEEEKPDDVLGNIYILPEEEEESPMRDAKEFATLLNACGRMEKASFGIGACLGTIRDKQKALDTLAEYRKQIVGAINWYRDHEEVMEKGDGYIILNAGENVPANIIGTLASIVSKSNELKEGTYVLSFARSKEGMSKASLRISGYRNEEIDLRDVIKEIVEKVGGEAGGHKHAAGALIESSKEGKFLEIAKDILSKK
jgi:RecJ-like exonuclease